MEKANADDDGSSSGGDYTFGRKGRAGLDGSENSGGGSSTKRNYKAGLRDFSESDTDSVDDRLRHLNAMKLKKNNRQDSYSETSIDSSRSYGNETPRKRKSNFDMSGVPDNRKLKTYIHLLIVSGIILEIVALLIAIFIRFYFADQYAQTSGFNTFTFLIFACFTVGLVVADGFAYKPSWSYTRLALHIVNIVGFALFAIIVGFGLAEIAPELTGEEGSIYSFFFWLFVIFVLIRVGLFSYQFFLTYKRTMTFRALLFQ